ncbi:MAG: hypothetical protein GXP33_14435 [Spirochaetes bacterium]|nr:hypothetical protein [Spirochaetota bacterium]
MKRIILITGFFFSLIFLFAEVSFFTSNEIGMALKKIPFYRTDEYKYVLMVERSKLTENRVLLFKGEKIKRKELHYNKQGRLEKEKSYEKEKLVSIQYYDSYGKVIRLEYYKDGDILRKEDYRYVHNRISEKQVYNSEGDLLYTDFYTLNSMGMLIKLVRKWSAAEPSETVLIAGREGITAELTGYSDTVKIVRYNRAGGEIETEQWKGNTLISRKTIYRNSKTGKRESSVEEDYVNNTVSSEEYDDQGNPVSKEVKSGDKIVSEETYSLDNKGRIVKKIRKSKEHGMEEWDYRYDSEGNVTEEKYFVRGVIGKITAYPDKEHKVEKLYRNGEEFIRLYYKGGKKFKEEIISGDKVIKTRKLKMNR